VARRPTAGISAKPFDVMGITDPTARDNWARGFVTRVERRRGFGRTGQRGDSNARGADGGLVRRQGLHGAVCRWFRDVCVSPSGTSRNIYDPVANIAAGMKLSDAGVTTFTGWVESDIGGAVSIRITHRAVTDGRCGVSLDGFLCGLTGAADGHGSGDFGTGGGIALAPPRGWGRSLIRPVMAGCGRRWDSPTNVDRRQ